MRIISTGMYPSDAINNALRLYDATTEDKRIRLLLENKTSIATLAKEYPKTYQSKQTIDLNLSELLGIGLVSAYYDWVEDGKGQLYQAVVGVEDAVKNSVENYLSDGGVYQNSSRDRMLYQQTMVQGFKPVKSIGSADVSKAIEHKLKIRDRYPENCGLIVNIYSKEGDIDFRDIIKNTNFNSFQRVFVIWYDLPDLKRAIVYDLIRNEKNRGMAVNDMKAALIRYEVDDEVTFDYSRADHYWKK